MEKKLLVLLITWGFVFLHSFAAVRKHALIVSSHQSDIAKLEEWRNARLFSTIAEAANQALAGDTLYIEGGTYEEAQVTFRSSGSLDGGYIVVCPFPNSGKVILSQGNSEVFDDKTPVFDLINRAYVKVEGLEFSGIKNLLTCIRLTRASHCIIHNNIFKDIGNSEVSPTYDGNSILLLKNATDCVVSHNQFEDSYGDAVCLTEQRTKRNLVCHNSFRGLKGKKRSWANAKYSYSSAITGSDDSQGHNLIAFNQIEGGKAGIWLDRDGSQNFIVGNTGNGGERLVFNESRCASNWIYENEASNMTVAGYSSALYSGTGWSKDTRWVGNRANNCKVGFYFHKSMRDTLIANIVKECDSYSLVFSDSASSHGSHYLAMNKWGASSLGDKSILYKDMAVSSDEFYDIFGREDLEFSTGARIEIPTGRYSEKDVSRVWVDFDDLVVVTNGAGSYGLKIRLSHPTPNPMALQLKVVAGDAVPGEDYNLSTTLLSFDVGELEKIVPIEIRNIDEGISKLIVLQVSDYDGKLCSGRCYSVVQDLIPHKQQTSRIVSDIVDDDYIIRTEYFDLNGRKVAMDSSSHVVLISKSYMKNGGVKIKKIVR